MSDAIYRIKTMMGGLGKSEVKLHMLPFQSSKLRYIFFPEAQAHTHTWWKSKVVNSNIDSITKAVLATGLLPPADQYSFVLDPDTAGCKVKLISGITHIQ